MKIGYSRTSTADQQAGLEAQIREQRMHDIQREQASQNQQLALYVALEKMLKKDVEDKANSIQDLGKKSYSVEAVKEDIEVADAMAKKAGNAQEAMRAEHDAPARVTKMDDPYVVKRDGMGVRAGGIAGLIGFLVGALGVA